MTVLPPLMLGYLRDDLVDDPTRWDTRIAEVAAAEGFELGEIFHEQKLHSGPVPPQFLALIDALRRADAHVVAIPAGHLSGLAIPQMCLLDRLKDCADAQIYEV